MTVYYLINDEWSDVDIMGDSSTAALRIQKEPYVDKCPLQYILCITKCINGVGFKSGLENVKFCSFDICS